MVKMTLKSKAEIEVLAEGGKRLGEVREKTAAAVVAGITTAELDEVADELIKQFEGKASFKMVPGYKHATCINLNDVVVHGIPGNLVINPGDKVGIDVGMFYKGWHTDTATTVVCKEAEVQKLKEVEKFLEVGRQALNKAIEQARPGKRIMDISKVMQEVIVGAGFSPVMALTGHGIGRQLHEEPAIPCFVVGDYNHSVLLEAGAVLAIEVMYNAGESEVAYKNDDGWTIVTADGKISGLFEKTVAVTNSGPVILTN